MKVSINICSLVERKEQLINTIKSVVDQVDIVNVCLNNYLECPYEHPKVNYFYSDNVFTDSGKFLFVKDFKGYYLTLDDDLIVGPTYVVDTIKMIDKYKVVSYHGRSFLKFPIKSYHKTPAIRNRCLAEQTYTEPVQICGSGVMGFDTNYFNPPMSIFKKGLMSDIWISIYAREKNIYIWGLKHSATLFKYQHVENTIYEKKVNDCEYETELVNKYFQH